MNLCILLLVFILIYLIINHRRNEGRWPNYCIVPVVLLLISLLFHFFKDYLT